MPENDWTLLELAWLALSKARLGALGPPPREAAVRQSALWATHRLQRERLEGFLRLRGFHKGELVDVPALEAVRLKLDCPRSRLGRPRLWDYHNVQVRTVDVERLAREAGGNEEATAETQTPAAPSSEGAAAPDAQQAGPRVRAVASWLRHIWPEKEPDLPNEAIIRRVHEEAGDKLRFSPRTFDRAKRQAWPPRQTAPDDAKTR